VNCAASLPDGVHFVVGLGLGPNSGEVRLYHVDGTLVHTFKGQDAHRTHSWVVSVAVTPDGQHIISGTVGRLFKVWSVATKSLVSTCEWQDGEVRAVAVTPDGNRILSGSYGQVQVWLLDGTPKNTFRLHTSYVNALVALPDNQHALSGSQDKTVKLFNVNDGAVLRTFRLHTDAVLCLALLPDGLRFVTASRDKTARIAYHGLAPHPQ
jgi:WD40 repeat protein